MRLRALEQELHTKFRDKNANPEELKQQIGKWREAREQRRGEHRHRLLGRWGMELGKTSVTEELRVHAHRLARLQRMEELVATDRKGDDRTRLLDKIEKLRKLEAERHERAMVRLTSAQAAASASAAAAPNALPPAGSAATGGKP